MSQRSTQAFCWHDLITTDNAKATDFYQSLFGWQRRELNAGDINYTIFKQGDADICGVMQLNENEAIPAQWLSYIKVDDVKASHEKAISLGATTVLPVKELKGFGVFSILKDPSGATFALWQKTADDCAS